MQLTLFSKPLRLMLSCLSQLHIPPALYPPSLSFFMLLVQMQKKSIIIFYFFEVQLCRAENEPAITDEANALLIIDPDVAWVLFSM